MKNYSKSIKKEFFTYKEYDKDIIENFNESQWQENIKITTERDNISKTTKTNGSAFLEKWIIPNDCEIFQGVYTIAKMKGLNEVPINGDSKMLNLTIKQFYEDDDFKFAIKSFERLGGIFK